LIPIRDGDRLPSGKPSPAGGFEVGTDGGEPTGEAVGVVAAQTVALEAPVEGELGQQDRGDPTGRVA
jgi:hypothetical protein